MSEVEEDDLYCIECGCAALEYIETNAECDVWRCVVCKSEQQTQASEATP